MTTFEENMTTFEDTIRHYYGHLPHEAPYMELILSFMNEEKLEELEKVYSDSTPYTRYSNMQSKWQFFLNQEDLNREEDPDFYKSHVIEMLIFALNMHGCKKARIYAAHRLDKKKR